VARLPPLANLPVESDVPTLVVSGQFDILPASYGPKVARGLAASIVVSVPGAAHTPSGSGECVLSLLERFLEDPRGTLDQSCLRETETRFVTEPFARRLLVNEPPVGRLLLLASAVVLLLSAPLCWRVGSLTPLHRWCALAMAGLDLVFLAVFLASNPLGSMYGFSPLLQFASLLPVVSILPLAIAAVLCFRTWRRRQVTLVGGLYYALVVAAGFTFVWQLRWWHMLPLY
jgi:hypothetical protein